MSNAPATLIAPGAIILSWCSHHADGKGQKTEHLYTSCGWLVCLECHPEQRPAQPGEKEQNT